MHVRAGARSLGCLPAASLASPRRHPAAPTLQSDSVGRTIQGTIPNTNAAAQFSMAWLGISSAQLGQLEVKRYVKAIQAKMPPGACRPGAEGAGEGQHGVAAYSGARLK